MKHTQFLLLEELKVWQGKDISNYDIPGKWQSYIQDIKGQRKRIYFRGEGHLSWVLKEEWELSQRGRYMVCALFNKRKERGEKQCVVDEEPCTHHRGRQWSGRRAWRSGQGLHHKAAQVTIGAAQTLAWREWSPLILSREIICKQGTLCQRIQVRGDGGCTRAGVITIVKRRET